MFSYTSNLHLADVQCNVEEPFGREKTRQTHFYETLNLSKIIFANVLVPCACYKNEANNELNNFVFCFLSCCWLNGEYFT